MASPSVYTRDELIALCTYDVTLALASRKIIFNHRLWLPGHLRKQLKSRWNFQASSSSFNGANVSYSSSVDMDSCKVSADRTKYNDQVVIPPRFVHSLERQASRRAQYSTARRLHLPASTGVSGFRSTAVFECLNIHSLLQKFDDVVELCQNLHINLLCLTESWHDVDSPVLGRLRSAGFNVIDRPRPRSTAVDDLSVNHGGIVVVAAADITLSPIIIADLPSSFELLYVRAVVGSFAAIVVVLYRPGSAAVQQSFFDDLSIVLDRVANYQEPVYITGDFNIWLDRPDDPHADQLRLLVECYGLVLHATGPTHRLGGTLDAVITLDSFGRPDCVAVEDVGLSDHFLLRWEFNSIRRVPSFITVCSRPWRRLDIELFRSALSSSRLCQPDIWPEDIDEMATLYNKELNGLLHRILP
jgi:hypothetical protein